MLAQYPARPAAVGSVETARVPLSFRSLFLSSTLLLLTGCAAQPPVPAGPDPSEPNARAPRVDYRSTVSGYTSQRPVAPSAWKKQNEQVAPAPKSGG